MSHFGRTVDSRNIVFGQYNFGGPSRSGILPIDQSLIIADWSSDRKVVISDGKVHSWTDTVGGNVLSEPTNGPTFAQNATPSGQPALRFDGINQFLRMASFDLSAFQDVDWYCVTVRSKTGSTQQIIDFNGTVRNTFFSTSTNTAAIAVVGNVGQDNDVHSADATILNTFRVYYLRALVSNGAGAEADGFFDSSLTSFSTSTSSANNTDANHGSGELTLGQRNSALSNGNNYGGDIARIICADTSADSTAIVEFLAALYGIP